MTILSARLVSWPCPMPSSISPHPPHSKFCPLPPSLKKKLTIHCHLHHTRVTRRRGAGGSLLGVKCKRSGLSGVTSVGVRVLAVCEGASKQAYLRQSICTLQSDIHISTSDINVHCCSHSLRSPPRCQPPSSRALLLLLQSAEHPRAPPVRRSLCAAHRGCECVTRLACCVCERRV